MSVKGGISLKAGPLDGGSTLIETGGVRPNETIYSCARLKGVGLVFQSGNGWTLKEKRLIFYCYSKDFL